MTKPSDEALMRAADMLRGMQRSHEVEVAVATLLQEVSDAAKEVSCNWAIPNGLQERLAPFILPEPVDPLMDFLEAQGFKRYEGDTKVVHKELAKRGLKIVEASHDG